jgi:ADP-ribose pyrophosphatase
MPEHPKPRALARKQIYGSPWVNLYVDRVAFPNGNIIEDHHLVDFELPSIMALARDDAGRYVMVQVCRYPTGLTQWEFPAGHLEAGEDLIAGAQRELLEETGCRSADCELIYTYHPMQGISNQQYHIVRCRALPAEQSFDAVEIDAVNWFSEAEIWQMIRSGEMRDGYSLTAFLLNQHI